MRDALKELGQKFRSIEISPEAQIDDHVTIGSGTKVDASVSDETLAPIIKGSEEQPTTVGANCYLLGGVIIEAGVTIGNGTNINSASIGGNTHIGDDVRIEHDALIGENAHVGNRTKVERGGKVAPHAQIGDHAHIFGGTTASIKPKESVRTLENFNRSDQYFINVTTNHSDQHLVVQAIAGPAGNYAKHTITIPYAEVTTRIEEIYKTKLPPVPKVGIFNKPALDDALLKQELIRYIRTNLDTLLQGMDDHRTRVAEHQARVENEADAELA